MTGAHWRRELAPLELPDIVRYAGASGDFNPMHYDAVLARSEGLPTNLAHGMLGAGILGVLVGERFGPERIRGFGVRFVAPLWCGDQPVAEMETVSDTEEGLRVDLRLTVGGEAVTTGWAELLPGDMTQGASS